MGAEQVEKIADLYTRRHALREGVYGERPYANFGYWDRPNLTLEQACDALVERVAAAAQVGPGDRVLEVGCGYGAGAVHYTQRHRPASVVGIDVTEVRIRTGQEYVAKHGLSEIIQLRLGDATRMDFPAASFTQVLAVECAFHFQTRRDFLREAARVLVPGGRLAVADIIARRGCTQETFLAAVRASPFSVPENFYDADVYAGYLTEAGFDEVRIEPITDRTTTPFTDAFERLARETLGARGFNFLHTAQLYRRHRDAGAEYVLVSARLAPAP